jgi:hypothetical protein
MGYHTWRAVSELLGLWVRDEKLIRPVNINNPPIIYTQCTRTILGTTSARNKTINIDYFFTSRDGVLHYCYCSPRKSSSTIVIVLVPISDHGTGKKSGFKNVLRLNSAYKIFCPVRFRTLIDNAYRYNTAEWKEKHKGYSFFFVFILSKKFLHKLLYFNDYKLNKNNNYLQHWMWKACSLN